MKTTAKTGRKQKHHTDSKTGKPVVGLSKQPDGRWRIIGTSTKFTEPNEQRAIQKYREMTAQELPVLMDGRPTTWTMNAAEFRQHLENMTELNDAPFWDRVIWELTTRPKYAAEKTGFEKLAYLKELKPPEPSLTVKEVTETWKSFAQCSKDQKAKVLRAWEDFVTTTGIKTLSEITAPLCVAFMDHVHKRGHSGKHQQHTFAGAKTILGFSRKRAIAVKEISAALDCLRLMTPNETTKNYDPRPITVENWIALYAKATGDDKAMILLMLNACLYAREVIRLDWVDIKADGTLVGRRKKKGEFIRVAKLWPETLEALAAMDKTKGPAIFRAITGKRLKKDGAFARFRKLIVKAEVKDVTPSHLRDGAYSAAVAANVTYPLCQLLAGHASGMSDAYVLGDPAMVTPACNAVRLKYFGK